VGSERTPYASFVGLGGDIQALRERLQSVGLGRHADALAGLAHPSVRLTGETVDDGLIGAGQSKLGGHPDVPDDFIWPTWGGLPQAFIAQVNLAEFKGLNGLEQVRHSQPDCRCRRVFDGHHLHSRATRLTFPHTGAGDDPLRWSREPPTRVDPPACQRPQAQKARASARPVGRGGRRV
jgi:hypothetical protein